MQVSIRGGASGLSDEAAAGAAAARGTAEREYELLLGACLADGVRSPSKGFPMILPCSSRVLRVLRVLQIPTESS